MPSASFDWRSWRALERVVESRFWMFLTMTTSSGGRDERSRGRVVDEMGEVGVKTPKDPNAPKSEPALDELGNVS
jgi:hypothetical protein